MYKKNFSIFFLVSDFLWKSQGSHAARKTRKTSKMVDFKKKKSQEKPGKNGIL